MGWVEGVVGMGVWFVFQVLWWRYGPHVQMTPANVMRDRALGTHMAHNHD